MTEHTVREESLRAFVEEVFTRQGVPEADAAISADVLISADLRGISSHGVARLPYYSGRMREGKINPRPRMELTSFSPATALLDAGNGLGMVAGVRAMEECIRKAEGLGVGFVAVKNSCHFGIAGYYSMMALAHDMVGIALSNASPRVVPLWGREGMLGTNPFSIAIPSGREPPFVLDMATSAVSSGKIEEALRQGKPIPEGWVYDTGEKIELDERGMIPMSVLHLPLGWTKELGGHKGYGLALMVDLLSGPLSGANFGRKLSSAFDPEAPGAGVGHFFGALRVDGFRPVEEFKDAVDEAAKAPGRERVYVAGEPEAEAEALARKEGIKLKAPVVEKLQEVAESIGLEFKL
ncbi:MAG: Ldh family oxidoreductase [Nitrospinota bacterium]